MGEPEQQRSLFDLLRPPKKPRGVLETGALPDDCDELLARSLAQELHRDLEEAFGIVDLVFTDNRRRMVSIRKRSGRFQIRLHHMFLGCEGRVVEAIISLGDRGENPSARSVVRAYIHENRDAIRNELDPRALTTRGEHHDLEIVLDRVRDGFDEELDEVCITWGRRGRGRRSIRFGSFDFHRKLIRIHPALDAEWVPDYFVEFVVYHELLHAVCPPEVSDSGRRIIHTAEFRERETAFERYDDAMRWEAENLRRLVNR